MSKEKLIRADLLWDFFDRLNKSLDQSCTDAEVEGSESIRLVLFGRREMLKGMIDWVYENQMEFQEICDSMGYEIRSMDDS